MSSNKHEEETAEPKPVRYWNPGSYRYYLPRTATETRSSVQPSGLATKQLKLFYLISTAFKIAKIVAAVLIALVFIGWL